MAAMWLWAAVFLVVVLHTRADDADLIPGSPKDNSDLILSGGDLYLTMEQRDMLFGARDLALSKRNAVKDEKFRWTNATMPYQIRENNFNLYEISQIGRAMTEWERYTCMYFRFKTSDDKNFAYIQGGSSGCNSQLGMVGRGQAINLQSPGCRFKGLYLHEIGHALGLIHEHQRPDRDGFISLNKGNIDPNMMSAFTKYKADFVENFGSPYEYSSIMHYGLDAFSRGGYREFETMRVKYPEKKDTVGVVYKKELAYSDVYIINQAYKCADHCPKKNKCGSEGHLNENCECICKDGSSDCDRTKRNTDPGCKNEHKNSWQCYVWANQGECERNEGFMKKGCAKACGVCGAGLGKRSRCKDKLPTKKCEAWRGRGDCGSNPRWMKALCGKTCNFCKSLQRGCKDIQDAEKCRKWALDGECGANPIWMWENCALACGNCDGATPPTPPPKRKPKPGECADDHDLCEGWAASGECDANPTWMKANCKVSCGTCDGDGTDTDDSGCTDSNSQCAMWASTGECDANPGWMRANCKVSCGTCDGGGNDDNNNGGTDDNNDNGGGCADSDERCAGWASGGECENNPGWMSDNCKKSCKQCNGGGNDDNNGGSDDNNGGTDDNNGGTDDNNTGGDCTDSNSGCPHWTRHCNLPHIVEMCKKSCGKC